MSDPHDQSDDADTPLGAAEGPRPGPRVRLPVLLVVGILAITLGIGGGYLLTNLVDAGPRAGDSPAEVVRHYLTALAEGDAEEALSLGVNRPADTSLMTPEILAESNRVAPLTDITVREATGDLVSATFRLGGQRVAVDIPVVHTDRGPKLEQTWGVLRLPRLTGQNLPTFVYGVQITAEETPVFPGVYPVTTGHPLIDWGDAATAQITRPESYGASIPKLEPRLTAAGVEAFATATATFWSDCLAATRLDPEGCPFEVQLDDPAAARNVTWHAPACDPMTSFEPRIDFDNVYLAVARFDFPVVARWQQDGEPRNAERYVNGQATLDLTDPDHPTFAWHS